MGVDPMAGGCRTAVVRCLNLSRVSHCRRMGIDERQWVVLEHTAAKTRRLVRLQNDEGDRLLPYFFLQSMLADVLCQVRLFFVKT